MLVRIRELSSRAGRKRWSRVRQYIVLAGGKCAMAAGCPGVSAVNRGVMVLRDRRDERSPSARLDQDKPQPHPQQPIRYMHVKKDSVLRCGIAAIRIGSAVRHSGSSGGQPVPAALWVMGTKRDFLSRKNERCARLFHGLATTGGLAGE